MLALTRFVTCLSGYFCLIVGNYAFAAPLLTPSRNLSSQENYWAEITNAELCSSPPAGGDWLLNPYATEPKPKEEKASVSKKEGEEMGVASIDWMDHITATHICSLLKTHNIEFGMCMSGGWLGFSVQMFDLKRAQKLIQDDASIMGHKKMGYTVFILDETQPRLPSQPLKTLVLNLPLTQASKSKNLIPALRKVLQQPQLKQVADEFPIVRRLRYLRRMYVDDTRKPQTGYEVEVYLAKRVDMDSGATGFWFQVLAGGHVDYCGISEARLKFYK